MAQRANALDAGLDHVARPQPFLRAATRAHAFRRAGGDDVARLQRDPALMSEIRNGTLNSMWRVFEPCFFSPFTVSHRSSFCGSGISSAVTMQGPNGA